MIYDPENGKVKLARFTGSKMVNDSVGKPTSKIEDYWRVKTYVKPDEMLSSAYPVFPQPYAVAQSKCGGTWNDYNATFIVQVAKCNIDCWYCFVDSELRQGEGDWFSRDEVVSMWKGSGSGILRLSGGEPTLASPFIFELYNKIPDNCYLWVDTNLSTGSTFFDAYEKFGRDTRNMGMCGCFKGFNDEGADRATGAMGLLERQLEFARRLIADTHIDAFFYLTDAVGDNTTEEDVVSFFNVMRDVVDEYAPLRTYVLQVKNYSPTNQEAWTNHTGLLTNGKRPVDVWHDLCVKHYGNELVWIPCHQVGFKNRGWLP
jgi:uncharacterized Fe-S cluster-containing radical SAM superfamily protein